MAEQQKLPSIVYKMGFFLVFTAALAYIFWGNDLIPDALSSIPPTQFLGWIDDAVVLIIGLFVTRKWWARAFPNTKEMKIDWKVMAVYAPAIAAWLWYVFYGVDIIPDSIPYAGWFDDAAAFFLMMYVTGKIKKLIWNR